MGKIVPLSSSNTKVSKFIFTAHIKLQLHHNPILYLHTRTVYTKTVSITSHIKPLLTFPNPVNLTSIHTLGNWLSVCNVYIYGKHVILGLIFVDRKYFVDNYTSFVT